MPALLRHHARMSDVPTDARAFLAWAALRVDQALDEHLPAEGEGAPRLAASMRYSLLAGGKRLRPALALAACVTICDDPEPAVPYAVALECLHTYSLIHDDLPCMDDDDLRRGKPTSHVVYGEAHAVLTGDALHTEAFRAILDSPLSAKARVAQAELLAEAAGWTGMVGGQVEDLAADGQAPNPERLERIQRLKTGALLRASVLGGAEAGGASPDALRKLAIYGDALGRAFQIADDVLDVTASAKEMGKTPGKDAEAEKMTYVALEGVEAATARAHALAEEAIDALDGLPQHGLLAGFARLAVERRS